jgi:hypothetical protein
MIPIQDLSPVIEYQRAMMRRILSLPAICICLLTSLVTNPVLGQEPHHPKVSIVHRGVDTLKADLKSLIDLTSEAEQEQWLNLQDYLDLFAIGIDTERPIRVDILTGIQPTAYMIWLPYPEDGHFDLRDNLNSFEFETRRDPQDENLFRFLPPDQGWLRILPDIRYAVLVFTTPQDDALLKQLLMKAGDPLPEVQSLLDTGASMGVQLINGETSAEDQQKRRDSFAELRDVSMDAVQKRPDESETEYALRRLALSNQLDELERLMVESEALKGWVALDRENNTAELKFTATAIAETSLAVTISEFNQHPDAFAAVAPMEGAVFSGRLNHPIDELRQKNALAFIDLLGKDIDGRVAESTKLSTTEKDATLKLFHGLADLISEGIKTGNVNGFTESKPDGAGDFTTVSAVSSPNAAKLVDILPLLTQAGKDNTVELNIESVDGVTIHKIALAKGFVDLIDRIFGDSRDLYIGTSDSHVWLASGEGSLDLLKSMIQSIKEPESNKRTLTASINLLPWVVRWKQIADEKEQPEDAEARQQWRESLRRLGDAVEALKTDDSLSIDIPVTEEMVSGQFKFDTGLLRFVGKEIAAFTKENFAE